MAGLAARRIGTERLAALSRYVDQQQVLVDEPGQVARLVTLGLEFHAELAPGCGNSLLADIVGQLVNVERHPLWALVNQLALPDTASRQRQVDKHRAVLDAIRRGEARPAATAMRQHLADLDQTMFDGLDDSAAPA